MTISHELTLILTAAFSVYVLKCLLVKVQSPKPLVILSQTKARAKCQPAAELINAFQEGRQRRRGWIVATQMKTSRMSFTCIRLQQIGRGCYWMSLWELDLTESWLFLDIEVLPLGCQTAVISDLNCHPNISFERAPYIRNCTAQFRDELTCDQWDGNSKVAVKKKNIVQIKKGKTFQSA